MENVNVNISNTATFEKTYNIVTLKPGNYLELAESVNLEYTKYVIIYNFDLGGNTLEIPANCILEINGGDFKNGTLKGNNTILINTNEVDILSNSLTKSGTWREVENIVYLPENSTRLLSGNSDKVILSTINDKVYVFYMHNNLLYYIVKEDADNCGLIFRYTLTEETTETRSYDLNSVSTLDGNKLFPAKYREFKDDCNIVFPDNYTLTIGELKNLPKYSYSTLKNDPTLDEELKLKYKNLPTLTQKHFNQKGITYVIRYDYTLAGEIITIPPNCTLLFDGGNISNGTLKSENIVNELGEEITKNNTKIINPYKILIGANLVGKGFINLDYLHEILSEDDYEDLVLAEKTRDDTIYFIIES